MRHLGYLFGTYTGLAHLPSTQNSTCRCSHANSNNWSIWQITSCFLQLVSRGWFSVSNIVMIRKRGGWTDYRQYCAQLRSGPAWRARAHQHQQPGLLLIAACLLWLMCGERKKKPFLLMFTKPTFLHPLRIWHFFQLARASLEIGIPKITVPQIATYYGAPIVSIHFKLVGHNRADTERNSKSIRNKPTAYNRS